MKRIVLFVGTNIAVLLVLSVTLRLLGVDRWLTAEGLDIGALLAFSAVVGFTGAIISLLVSKPVAKWSTGAQLVDGSESAETRWLVETVRRLSEGAGIRTPDVAIYDGAPNAFATGAFKNSALVAVSTGLLRTMTREEVEAVLGHEVAHVANGDMVTLALIQGVVNTFVVFLARIVGYAVDKAIFKTERGTGPGFYITVIVCEIVFGLLASMIVMWFSRMREYRADRGAAALLGSPQPMIAALRRLGGIEHADLPQSIRALGINDRPGWMALFSSHPPLEKRIAALQEATA